MQKFKCLDRFLDKGIYIKQDGRMLIGGETEGKIIVTMVNKFSYKADTEYLYIIDLEDTMTDYVIRLDITSIYETLFVSDILVFLYRNCDVIVAFRECEKQGKDKNWVFDLTEIA